jgi:hypothetical protein
MNAEQMLDALADYQSQADYLALEKQRLIDEVKIPAEVLAAQDEANKARQKADSEYWSVAKRMRASKKELLSTIFEPEMPPEYVKAMEEARALKHDIEVKYGDLVNAALQKSFQEKAKIDVDLQAQVAEVYNQVAIRKQEINAEFDDKAKGVLDNIAKLTADVKAAVVEIGHTVKGSVYQAVYVKGRVTWITDMLDGMMIAFPALSKARKEGAPSVTLRKN